MKGMEKISQAILDKVKAEARDIIKEAEGKARERVGRAKKQREAKLEEEKGKLIEEAKEEATRILAQSSITARQELLLARTRIIDKQLADRITEIREFDGTGGVIAEDIDGKIRIDNTYDTRLEMLLPKLLPEIGKELFQGL